MSLSLDVGLSSLLETMTWYRQARLPADAVLRALLAECEVNRALLRLVHLDGGDDAPHHQDPAYLEVALRLKADVLRVVLSGDDLGNKVSAKLRKVQFVLPDDQDAPSGDGVPADRTTVEDRVRALAVAVASVRAAAELLQSDAARDQRSAGLRNIRMRQRLRNLSAAYADIAHVLREQFK